jgi:hypothetical protein
MVLLACGFGVRNAGARGEDVEASRRSLSQYRERSVLIRATTYRLILPYVKAQQRCEGALGFVLSDPPRGHAMECADLLMLMSRRRMMKFKDMSPAAFV